MSRPGRLLAVIGPGLLVAATGVGAGDLATGAFSGSKLGVAVLWAVAFGAFLKFVLTEGLARWQIATGETLLAGAVRRLGVVVKVVFPLYLLPWSLFVGAALISACGVGMHSLVPVFDDPVVGKRVFGVALSLLGILLVRAGGYRLFEKVMAATIAVMFVTVVTTAVLVAPDLGKSAPDVSASAMPTRAEELAWTIALIGGVGGTLTVLCYGYWLREEGRDRPEDLGTMRLDLGVGYVMTGLFGAAMVVIGSTIPVDSKGADLVIRLADRLAEHLGTPGRWLFLAGAFGAFFSSLLGVWQAVPYVFADYWRLVRREQGDAVDTRARPYRLYLYALGIAPLIGLFVEFKQVQKAYAIFGAFFIPLLAVTLLLMNGRRSWVGDRFRNRWITVLVLLVAIAFFVYYPFR